MNVRGINLAKAYHLEQGEVVFAHDVLEGLAHHPKHLPPKYFYDEAGSKLLSKSRYCQNTIQHAQN